MPVHSKLKQERLKELLAYNQTTGEFSWLKPRKGVKTGVRIGCDNGHGYLRITVDGDSYYAHRLAWIYVYGDDPDKQIDHINGNRSDNSIANLRHVSPSENQFNRHGAQANSKSGMIGVSWHKKASKWQAHIKAKGKRLYLGLYESEEDASAAYQSAKRHFHTIGETYASA